MAMSTERRNIMLLILLVCGWVGLGAANVWGGKGMLLMLALGLFWCWGHYQQKQWAGALCFLGLILISIRGVLENTQDMVFVSGMIGALAVWDLERFVLRLHAFGTIKNKRTLLRQHLLRLILVLGGSLFLFQLAFQIKLELKFWYAILLIGIILIGINRILHLLRSPFTSSTTQNETPKKEI